MSGGFKFHVHHGSKPYKKGTGLLDIDANGVHLELPVETAGCTEIAPKIQNVVHCQGRPKIGRPWCLPTLEIDVSRLPIFIVCALIIFMLPETLAQNWGFKAIGIMGCFYHILLVNLTRIVIEFEDNRYVCGEIDRRVCKHIFPY